MTDAEFKTATIALRNQWAEDSNKTDKQGDLYTICEQYIADVDALLTTSGNHPDPPPPRIRP